MGVERYLRYLSDSSGVIISAYDSNKEEMREIDIIDSNDFDFWKLQTKDYLYGRNLHLPLSREILESMKQPDWDLLDRQVWVFQLKLACIVAFNIMKEKHIAGVMNHVKYIWKAICDQQGPLDAIKVCQMPSILIDSIYSSVNGVWLRLTLIINHVLWSIVLIAW